MSRLLAAVFIAAAVAALAPVARASVTMGEVSGRVQIRSSGGAAWGTVGGSGRLVESGDEVRTGPRSRVVLQFDDGSKVEIGPAASLILEDAQPTHAAMRFNLGFMRAWVQKALARRFQVKTPTAVCSVRGTEFGVTVAQSGMTNVAVFSGLVGVADGRGNEVLLAQGQRVDVTQAGLLQKTQAPASTGKDDTRLALKREVGLDMTREEVQAAAAREIRSAVYQEGKAIVDVNGNRVRIEQYITRPDPNSFKLVVLDSRVDRFDYFFYHGTFNQALPNDLTVPLSQINGRPIVKPDYFLASYDTGRSNTVDRVVEIAQGGHVVDLNNNGVPGDAVTIFFDPRLNAFVRLNVPNQGGVGNDPMWKTLFQTYSLTFNGNPHVSWTPSGTAPAYDPIAHSGGLRSYNNSDIAFNDYGIKCVGPDCLQPTACVDGDHCTYKPQPGQEQFNVYRENVGGTVWDKFQNYVIDDNGKIANSSFFAGVTAGPTFKKLLMPWNFEQIITASEFGGRKIDLAVSPKILIESGIIQ